MIKHIVCYKLKNPDDIERTIEVLYSMKGRISQILDMEAGADFLHSPRSFDIVLNMSFKDRKAMEEYQQDVYHVEVVKSHMHSVTEKSVSVDYET